MRRVGWLSIALMIGFGGPADARTRVADARVRVEVPAESVMYDQGRPFDRRDRARTPLIVVADAKGHTRYYRMMDPNDASYCDKPQPWVRNGGKAEASRVRAGARVMAGACRTPGPPVGAYDDRGQWHPFKH